MELVFAGVSSVVERGPRLAGQLRRLLPVRRLLLHVLCPLRLMSMSKVGPTLDIFLREFMTLDLRIVRLIFYLPFFIFHFQYQVD